ncbi:beta-lactamase-like protein [Macrophomina phaseolina]|uniref:Beta-lactamase-like protein n=1 Tax=Macrophomina phaseolina TaxID=35725 RepID=A0ABQ8GD96_9PEZI|nr:beta-lactamase-like protein [Macrophomina phaseolina]
MGPLPHSDASVQLRLLDGGSLMAEMNKLHQGAPNYRFRMYDWAFHIFHPKLDRHVLWDVGIDGNPDVYPDWVQAHIFGDVHPVGPRISLQEQLQGHGVSSAQIDSVLFSHAHFDHARPIKDIFPNATGYFGPGTKEHCTPGHLRDPGLQWDGRFFDPEKATENWKEFEGPWVPFGPFERAMDFFGDGSFFVVQAPGHMPGNLCAVARVEGGNWILLGSDCCHSRELLDGKFDFAVFEAPNGVKMCLQSDIPAAKGTISRIKQLEDLGVHVALAHDTTWIKDGTDAVLMGLLDGGMMASVDNILKGERP